MAPPVLFIHVLAQQTPKQCFGFAQLFYFQPVEFILGPTARDWSLLFLLPPPLLAFSPSSHHASPPTPPSSTLPLCPSLLFLPLPLPPFLLQDPCSLPLL